MASGAPGKSSEPENKGTEDGGKSELPEKDTKCQEKTESVMDVALPRKMYLSQEKLANVLELAYLYAFKHPTTAEKVRLTAHGARIQQLLSCGMMKSVRLTADHIHKIMIPIILDGIKEKDSELISEAIQMTVDMIMETKKETEVVRDKNLEFLASFQTLIESVKKDIKQLEADKRTNEIEIKEQTQLAAEAERAIQFLEQERKRIEKEMQARKEERERLLKKTEETGDENVENHEQAGFMDACIGGALLLVSLATVAIAPVGAGVLLGSRLITAVNIERTISNTAERLAYLREEGANQDRASNQERYNLLDQEYKKRKDKWSSERTIEELEMQIGMRCDAQSLYKVVEYAGQLNNHFAFLTLFWEDLISALGVFGKAIKTGKLFRKLDSETRIKQLEECCAKAEKDWQMVARIGGDYERSAKSNLDTSYAFMSTNYDSLKGEKIEDRKKELMQNIAHAMAILHQ